MDYVKDDPSIFLHSFTFRDENIADLRHMDGIISYTVPPREVMKLLGKKHPPLIAITMCKPADPSIVCAHIDPDGVARRVVGLLKRRRCRSYAFCSSHAHYFAGESAALMDSYRREVLAQTGQTAKLFRPIATLNPNLIDGEVRRFTEWLAAMPKPCGMFVHGDDVARKMLDTCRLRNIKVPGELRVIGTDNSPMFCERTFPTLSSYAIDHAKTAYEAAHVLEELIDRRISPDTASYEIALSDVIERASSMDEHGRARVAHDAQSFIRTQLKHGITPSARDIAFHLNVSIRKIQDDFTATYGHTLRDEIGSFRLDLLRKSLRASNLPIKTLVARAGYSDMSQATRTFKAHVGMTMSAYRKSR